MTDNQPTNQSIILTNFSPVFNFHEMYQFDFCHVFQMIWVPAAVYNIIVKNTIMAKFIAKQMLLKYLNKYF